MRISALVDLPPALVTAAALLIAAEAAVVGLTVGICYDLSFTGVDDLYPLFSCCSAMPRKALPETAHPQLHFHAHPYGV
ncbi:MAG: hypothetical protein ACLSGI_08915 [Butyricicoccaceae bacterium]